MKRSIAVVRTLTAVMLFYGLLGPTAMSVIAQDQTEPPTTEETTIVDTDGDGVADDGDNCPTVANADQADSDGDSVGDACAPAPEPEDPDSDGDGVADSVDNCVNDPNADQANADGDEIGDACDESPNGDQVQPVDSDRDRITDDVDNCPNDFNRNQNDADGDGIGDACDATPNGDEEPVEEPVQQSFTASSTDFTAQASGSGVEPIFVEGNQTCGSLAGLYGGGESWIELKADPPDSGVYTDGILTVTVTRTGEQTFNWTSNIGIDAVFAKGGPEGNLYLYDPESTGDTGLESPRGLSHISFCYDIELEVTKTAQTSFTRTFTWTIDKSVTPGTWNLFEGDTGTSDYTVTVTKSAPVDSNWAVSGTISITNPSTTTAASITGVTDQISGGIDATVDCGVTFPHSLGAGQTLNCSYSSPLPDGTNRTNTATVTTSGPIEGGTGTAPVTFGDPTTVLGGSITVDDTNAAGPQNEGVSSSTEFEYSITFDCEDLEYTENVATYTVPNTATIVETEQSDDASVTVNCYRLAVSKDAETELTRTYEWTIDKAVTPGTWDLFDGDSGTSDYTITVTKSEGADSGFMVEGTITIVNPNPSRAATLTGVTDLISGAPDIDAEVDCPSLIVPANGSLVCSYSAELPDGETRTNTATATLQNYDFSSSGGGTPSGTTNFSGTASVDFTNADVTEIDPTVTLDDTNPEGPQNEVLTDSAVRTYSIAFDCANVEYVDGFATYTVPNTATLIETEQSDDASVVVNCYELSVIKTASPELTRTWTWTIEKSVDPTSLELFPGEATDVIYTVTLGATSVDSDYAVTGTITISNPAPIDLTLTSVSDIVAPDIDATVDCPSLVVPAEGSLVCTYSADLTNDETRLNTAAATYQNYDYDAEGNATPTSTTSVTGSANVDFANAVIDEIDECVDVSDVFDGGDPESLGQVCASDLDQGVFIIEYLREISAPPGECDDLEFPNVASFVTNDTEKTDEADALVEVDVLCGSVTVVKTGDVDRDGDVEPDEFVEGACFDLYVTDGIGNAVGNPIASDCTDEFGELTFSILPPGEYLLRETFAPLPFGLIDDVVFTIPDDEGTLDIVLNLADPLAEIQIPVFKLNCDVNPSDEALDLFLSEGTVPEDCVRAGNIDFYVTHNGVDDSDNPYTTGADGGFLLTVVVGDTVVIVEDVSTIVGPYVPRDGDTVTIDPVVENQEGVVFVNLLAEIDIEKGCPTIPAGARVGDDISYEVTITNTGAVTLTGIVFSDSRDGDLDAPFPASLAPGEFATRTFTTEILQSDAVNGNVDNTATVTTDLDGVSDSDTAECPFTPVSSIDIEKTCPTIPAGARVGDEISYQVTVTNTGDVTLTGIVVTDDRDGEFDSPFPTELGPGQSATRTFTSTITLADAAAGNVDNTATVTTDDEQVSDSDTVECPFDPVRSIDVEKTCPTVPAGARVGDPITFSVTVTNTGDVTLTGIVVTDDRDGSFSSPFPTSLAPGASATRIFTSTITETDAAGGSIDNTVTVTTDIEGVSDSDTVECPFTPVESISIEKTCPTIPSGAQVGDEISYLVTITNTGDVTLTGIVVSDEREGEFDSSFPTELAPGESATRTFTTLILQSDADSESVDNTATVTTDDETVSDTVTAECPFTPGRGIDIEKGCPTITAGARVGDEISYSVTITNTGDVTLTGIAFSDSRAGDLDEPFPTSLGPGESVTRTFTTQILAADAAAGNVNNTATVTTDDEQVSDSDIAECLFTPVRSVDIEKGCPTIPAGARVGDEISYQVTVTNTGDVTLTGIVVTDDRDGEFDGPFPTELTPGASATRTFTSTITAQDAVAGNVDNTVTVNTAQGASDTDTAECPFTPVSSIDIEKSCPTLNGTERVGDEITYSITITNTGDVTLTGIAVSDSREGELSSPFPTSLAPGQSATRTFTTEILPADAVNGNVDNTATVTTDSEGVSDTDTVDCPFVPVKGIETTKSCPTMDGTERVGDEISYSVTITNTGEVTVTGIVVTDSRDGAFDSPFPTELGPGESATRTFTGTITAQDAAEGNVDNTATVTTDDEAVTDTATVDCPFVPIKTIEITKSCPTMDGTERVGDEITYEVTITNTGDVTLTGIVVTDERAGEFNSPFPTELGPGESATRTFTTTILAGDAEAGNVDNVVSVTTDDEAVQDEVTADCPFVPVKGIEVLKSCPATVFTGDEVQIDATVTNTGDVSLTITSVFDDLVGGELDPVLDGEFNVGDEDQDGLIDPGEIWEYVGSYTAGETPGTETNTVVVTAEDVLGTVVTDESDCETEVLERTGAVEVLKTGPDGDDEGTEPDPLTGACFTLTSALGNHGEKCTDETGIASWTGLPTPLFDEETGEYYGEYVLVETQAPEGFVPLTDPIPVRIVFQETVKIEVPNLPVGLVLTIPVFKLDCDTNPGTVTIDDIFNETYPDNCRLVEGVEFDVTQDGVALAGPFVTDEFGGFEIEVEVGSRIVITEDTTTATEGFGPIQNPITIEQVAESQTGVVFVNLPVGSETETPEPTEPVKDLPNTGTGPFGDDDSGSAIWLAILALGLIGGGCVANGVAIRKGGRRRQRQAA